MDTLALQERLIALGYDVGKAGADGVFGRSTLKAVANFQNDFGVPVKWLSTVGQMTIDAQLGSG